MQYYKGESSDQALPGKKGVTPS